MISRPIIHLCRPNIHPAYTCDSPEIRLKTNCLFTRVISKYLWIRWVGDFSRILIIFVLPWPWMNCMFFFKWLCVCLFCMYLGTQSTDWRRPMTRAYRPSPRISKPTFGSNLHTQLHRQFGGLLLIKTPELTNKVITRCSRDGDHVVERSFVFDAENPGSTPSLGSR